MLQVLKKLFRKAPPANPAPEPTPSAAPDSAGSKPGYGGPPLSKVARVSPPGGEPAQPAEKRDAPAVAPVETTSLSLRAILERFPEGLLPTIAKMPDPEVRVVLPVSSILKQLPEGSVKMSLTSIHRQAPVGTFHPIRPEEKRMIPVPLAEVFRSFRLDLLKRRPDRRMHEFVGTSGLDLFSKAPAAAAQPTAFKPPAAGAPAAESPLGREMPVALVFEPKNQGANQCATPARAPEPPKPETPTQPAAPPRLIVPPPGLGGPPPVAGVQSIPFPGLIQPLSPAPADDLELPLAELMESWPEPLRLSLLERCAEGARVTLPAGQIREGLAKGRVTVTWSQIRQRITPGPVDLPSVSEGLELVLPLQVVAPAFLKGAPRKKAVPEPEIPSLFSRTPLSREPAAPSEAASALPELKLRMPEAFRVELSAPAAAGTAPAPGAGPAPGADPKRVPEEPRTVGGLFGKPAQTDWSPAEIVEHLARLPEVAGAVVALEEGLVVAHSLPEPMKGEAVAAFLPQIFSRIHGYAREMGLAEVEALQITTGEGDFQVFRLGFVFFAVLSKKGEVLPDRLLRLLCEELTRQTRESPVEPTHSQIAFPPKLEKPPEPHGHH
jgi:predicted regulator of Ras-like GTPase activity (Roadblock/LC7/MglB family)